MADVTGPIRSMPGSIHKAEGNCDDHPDRLAVKRVQGETDSFGSEMYDMCQECYDQYRKDISEADTSGYCDHCKCDSDKLFNYRDPEEGSYGPIYRICKKCSDKALEYNDSGWNEYWEDRY